MYFVLFYPLAVSCLMGKWTHSLWGQGKPTREDEHLDEYRVRVHWVYCLDGPMLVATALDAADLWWDVPLYTQRKFTSLIAICITCGVTCAFVGANTIFLEMIRR